MRTAGTIVIAGPNARPNMKRGGQLTLLLKWPQTLVAQYIEQYLEGAKTKQVGRFCAVQHPTFEAYGETGLYDIAYANRLPIQGVVRSRPL